MAAWAHVHIREMDGLYRRMVWQSNVSDPRQCQIPGMFPVGEGVRMCEVQNHVNTFSGCDGLAGFMLRLVWVLESPTFLQGEAEGSGCDFLQGFWCAATERCAIRGWRPTASAHRRHYISIYTTGVPFVLAGIPTAMCT